MLSRERQRRLEIETARAYGRQHRSVDQIGEHRLDAISARPPAAEIAFQLFRSGRTHRTSRMRNELYCNRGSAQCRAPTDESCMKLLSSWPGTSRRRYVSQRCVKK